MALVDNATLIPNAGNYYIFRTPFTVDALPVEFTEEGFRQLLNLPFAGPAIQAAYLDCLRGRKAKN